jgi:hypothetical protein
MWDMCGRKGAVFGFAVSTESAPLLGAAIDLLPPTPTASFSRLAAGRYLDYLKGQKAAMTGQSGAHTNRPELVAVHGNDTKYAMHALRLGLQGIELLSTGRIGYLNFWTRNQ